MNEMPPPMPPPKPMRTGEENSIDENGFSVATARALFEAAKKPEVQRVAVAAAKNPVIRNAAITAAKDEKTRNQILNAYTNSSTKPTLPPKSSSDGPPPPPPPHRGQSARSSQPAPPPVPKPTYSYSSAPTTSSYGSSSQNTYTPPAAPISNFSAIRAELEGIHLNQSRAPPPKPLPSPSVSVAPLSSPTRPPPPRLPPPTRPPPPKPASAFTQTSEPHGTVKYPFVAQHSDELSCETGDIVLLKKEVDQQWLYGMNTRTGTHGIIPMTFLDIRIPLAPTTNFVTPVAQNTGQITATALYDYTSMTPGDLQFRAGDVITVIEKVDKEWLLGSIYGQEGVFPATFVHCPSLHFVPMTTKPAAPLGIFTALYDYSSNVPGDLFFKAGDRIEVMEYVGSDWVRGRLNGMEGMLPFTYLTSTNSPAPQMTGLASIQSIGKSQSKIYQAIDDHHSDDPSNLWFSRGDRLLIVETVDDHFLRGKLEEFRTLPPGLVPRHKVIEV